MVKESNKKIQIDEYIVQSQLKDVLKNTVEEAVNNMLDAEDDHSCNFEGYIHTPDRKYTVAKSIPCTLIY